MHCVKIRQQRIYRPITPKQHAQLLNHLSSIDIDIAKPQNDVQAESCQFYTLALGLLNRYYPEKTITVSSRDPAWMTAGLKPKLRRKNRLMRKSRVEEASALAKRIGKTIEDRNRTLLRTTDGEKLEAKDVWAAVRQLTGRTRETPNADGISAETLNNHYSIIFPLIQTTPHLVASSQPSWPRMSISVSGKYSVCSIVRDPLPLASTLFQHGSSNLALQPSVNQSPACTTCP